MVQLRVAVTDSAGHYVRDLSANDFSVAENGVKQNIRLVSTPAAEAPTTVFVLFDTSDRMYQSFVYAEDAISNFIHHLSPQNGVAVYSFSRNVTRLVAMTRDRLAALVGLRRAVSGDETSLYDSVLVTLREAEKVPGGKILVVFSNGPDTASFLAPEDVRGVAEDLGIPIYVVSARDQAPRSNAVLRELTQSTGGKTYFATRWQDQRVAFESIDADIKNSYVISYYPRGGNGAGYRKLDVKLTGQDRGYQLRTRTGYRASE
jgi:VWFA-related protein